MATNYAELLRRFDPIGIARYQITARDLETVHRYLMILQSDLPRNSWNEALTTSGEYGTSVVVHEVVQIRGLLRVGFQPLRNDAKRISEFLDEHREIHAAGLYEEHLYLQDVLMRKFGEHFKSRHSSRQIISIISTLSVCSRVMWEYSFMKSIEWKRRVMRLSD